jgi:hypothetical protein
VTAPGLVGYKALPIRNANIQVWHRPDAGEQGGWWVALRGTYAGPEHGPFATEEEADSFGRALLRVENERMHHPGAAL